MRLLVLGGTGFVGRAVVEEARAAGASVAVFNRGLRGEAPDGVERLFGDRLRPADLAPLAARAWDAVVDTWAREPWAVRDSAAALRDAAGRYLYVSSRSVYAELLRGADESAPVVDAVPDAGRTDYARDKRGGELAACAAFGDRALLARAGLILGPYEDVGRLPWWLLRVARGGRVLAPGPQDLPLQYVDARDLARFLLHAADRGLGGAYNVVSEPGHATMRSLLEACCTATGSPAELVWVDPDRVLAAGVEPWTELPVWVPPGHAYEGLHGADVSKALAAGLHCRPVEGTVADTWAWLRSVGGRPALRPDLPPPGLDRAKEEAILASR